MARRDLAAKQPDAAAADDRKPDAFGLISLMPASGLALISATADSAWLVSGRSTGSPRSADRSAAI